MSFTQDCLMRPTGYFANRKVGTRGFEPRAVRGESDEHWDCDCAARTHNHNNIDPLHGRSPKLNYAPYNLVRIKIEKFCRFAPIITVFACY